MGIPTDSERRRATSSPFVALRMAWVAATAIEAGLRARASLDEALQRLACASLRLLRDSPVGLEPLAQPAALAEAEQRCESSVAAALRDQ